MCSHVGGHNGHSAYLASYLTPWVRKAAGLDDGGMVELGAAVMHYVVARGVMLEPPFENMRALDFQSGGRLADAPRPGLTPPA